MNNVLLYGESGTGKSATVKHLLTLPGLEELRLIEADKENLGGLPALIRSLDGRRQKFIVFIDDLTFDRDDPTYSILKTILEGGVERRPQNVAVYATSNRRHLVRQYRGLPLYHVYCEIFTDMADANAPIQAFISKDGIEYLDIEKIFEISDEGMSVPLAAVDVIAETVANKYNHALWIRWCPTQKLT